MKADMKSVLIALAMLAATPICAGQSSDAYLLENGLDSSFGDSPAVIRNKKSGCQVVVHVHSTKRLATEVFGGAGKPGDTAKVDAAVLTAIKEVCPDGATRPVKGSSMLPYGPRGRIPPSTPVTIKINY